MAEYIERDALLNKLCEENCNRTFEPGRATCANCYLGHVLSEAPAADVAPVVHGRWEPCFDENGRWRQGFAKCPNCKKEYYAHAINHFNYCPNCGARMDGGADHAAD